MLNFTTFWCFRINTLSRKISRMYNNRCLNYGVTSTQSFVLFDVMNHEGTNVKDIANRIQLDSPAVTGLIDRLEKNELIERQECLQDRRSLKIYLTPKGRELTQTQLVPVILEFNFFLRNMLESEMADTFEQCLNLIEQQLESNSKE